MARRRVVITGLGIVSPVGNSVAEAWANVVAGKSGITRVTRFDASQYNSQIAGEVKNFDVTRYLPAKDARRMDTFIHYGMAAAIDAIKDSGIEVTGQNAERIGVNVGSGIGGLPMIEDICRAPANPITGIFGERAARVCRTVSITKLSGSIDSSSRTRSTSLGCRIGL